MPANTVTATRLLTRKTALAESKLQKRKQSAKAAAGELLLRLERFALSSNNITYAAFGKALQYWQFFPTEQPEWGQVPVWGFAEVLSSGVAGIVPGERFFGYFPLASHVTLRPQNVTAQGFFDASGQRLSLSPAYNQYLRCDADPDYEPAQQDLQLLLRPLHICSYMLADYLWDHNFFGAQRVVFSSASSKTAYGTAFELREQIVIHRVALTAEAHVPFVENLGLYDRVYEYGRLHQVPADRATVYVDFSGDPQLRARVHNHFASVLVHDCFAGSTHNMQPPKADPLLPGPKPVAFYAPEHIRKRQADWGWDRFTERMNAARKRFYSRAIDPLDPWIVVVEHEGIESARKLIEQLCVGALDPQQGHIVKV